MPTRDNRSPLTVDTAGAWQLYATAIPEAADVIGTVTRGKSQIGALIRFRETGQYAQLNAGAICTLDGRKVAAALGESGRPAVLEGGRKVTLYIDAPSLDAAREIGAGNVSAGIRKALELAKAAQQ